MKESNSRMGSRAAWIALGSLLALGLTMLVVKEIPAMRREFRLMRM